MRRLCTVIAVVAASFTVLVGAASAQEPREATYEVSDSWQLTYIEGRPTVLPQMEDDVVEVRCWGSDQMTDWKANDDELAGDSYPRTDGTGIQVKPHFTGETETLTITVTCHRA